jgi:hypothetical protein
MDESWRIEVLNDEGIWESVQFDDLKQWQVVRVFESEGRPIRWHGEPDGCCVFIMAGPPSTPPSTDAVVEGEQVRIRCFRLPLLPLRGVDKLAGATAEQHAKVWDRRLRLAVNEWCACGGYGPDDDRCCPACGVWHMAKYEDREEDI